MYKDYLKEREGLEVIESEIGFATYVFRRSDCYIKDIYVKPEHRKSGEAKRLADEIAKLAKDKGLYFLVGSVDLRDKQHTRNDKVLRAYGMNPGRVEGTLVYYFKELV